MPLTHHVPFFRSLCLFDQSVLGNWFDSRSRISNFGTFFLFLIALLQIFTKSLPVSFRFDSLANRLSQSIRFFRIVLLCPNSTFFSISKNYQSLITLILMFFFQVEKQEKEKLKQVTLNINQRMEQEELQGLYRDIYLLKLH